MAQRAERQIQMTEVPGSMLTGVTLYCWIFFDFYVIIAKSVCLWKTQNNEEVTTIAHLFTLLGFAIKLLVSMVEGEVRSCAYFCNSCIRGVV